MLTWDGTDITNIISDMTIYECKNNKITYWILRKLDSVTGIYNDQTCIVRSCKNTTSCLIDELKPIFGLKKLGTHWCKINNRFKLLIKPVTNKDGYIQEELKLNLCNFPIRKLLKLQIQEIFVFRELLGVTCTYESSIILREGANQIYPMSFYEPNMSLNDTKILPCKILEKWFNHTSVDTVVKRLLKIHNIYNMASTLHDLRTKIEETIERVDRQNIGYKSIILNRITQRLQTSLEIN